MLKVLLVLFTYLPCKWQFFMQTLRMTHFMKKIIYGCQKREEIMTQEPPWDPHLFCQLTTLTLTGDQVSEV